MTDVPSLYVRDGDGFVATLRTQGAWHPDHSHGSPVQALMTWAVEQVPTLVPMQVARLTHDMVRPAPIGPRLHLDTTVLREGKRIQLVEVVLRVGDLPHVRTRALRIRVADVGAGRVPASTPPSLPPPPPIDDLQPLSHPSGWDPPGFLEGVELRRFTTPGRHEAALAFWVRLKLPVLPGEPITPLQRLAAAGDMVNTIGVVIDPTKVSTINPDVTLNVLRPPVGEWVAVQGSTTFRPDLGVGISDAELSDRVGRCAVGSAAQLVEAR